MIVIYRDIRSVARLNLVGRDHDLHQATHPHIATLAPASLATEIEPMVTSNEYRWMDHKLVNTGRDIMVSAPALNQGEDLYELPEAGSADQPGRVKSMFRFVTVLAPTTDRREDLASRAHAAERRAVPRPSDSQVRNVLGGIREVTAKSTKYEKTGQWSVGQ